MAVSRQAQAQRTDKKAGIFYGWWIVAIACAVMGYCSGIVQYGSTLFFKPVSESLGLSRSVFSLVITFTRLEGTLEAPLVGYLIDRFGPRWLMMAGMTIGGIGLILFSLFTHSLLAFVVFWAVMVASGLGGVGGYAPSWAAINNWFVRKKGLAMGLGQSSHGIGGAVLVPILAVIIAVWDWRIAAAVAGVGVLVLVLPLTFFVRTRPEEMGLKPDGDPLASPPDVASAQGLAAVQPSQVNLKSIVVDFTVRQALRTSAFWFLTLGMGIRALGQSGIVLHLAPMLQDKGFGTIQAGGSVGLLAMMSIPGAMTCGWLSDYLPRRFIMATIVAMEIVGLIVLLLATSTWQIYVFLMIYGFGQGAHVINRSLLGEYFGQRSYAKIWGVMSVVNAALSWGAVYAGWVYDATGNYNIAILTFIFLYMVSAFLYANCRRPKAPQPVAA